jgi:hypothetical protein
MRFANAVFGQMTLTQRPVKREKYRFAFSGSSLLVEFERTCLGACQATTRCSHKHSFKQGDHIDQNNLQAQLPNLNKRSQSITRNSERG